MKLRLAIILTLTLLLSAFACQAQEAMDIDSLREQVSLIEEKLAGSAAEPGETQKNLNLVWTVVAAALVFFMQAGFCLLESGSARAKNSINVVMKNVLDFCVSAVAYLFIGFALMFGTSYGGWLGVGPFWLSDFPAESPIWSLWIFQVVFAGTAATIISGAMAERTKFIGYVIFSAVISGLIYPVLGHWAWGGAAAGIEEGFGEGLGWLGAMGFADFAGSTVVHGIGGAAALAGVIVIGPRVGRFAADGSPRLIPAHNIPMAALGTFILWFGWFGFNAGSTLAGTAEIGRIAVNTLVAASIGGISAMLTVWTIDRRPDVLTTLNGTLGGLVAITACCNVVTPFSAFLIGFAAGIITALGTMLLEKVKVDDVVGAVPVHLFCGIWGTLCVALFHEDGFVAESLQIQAIGALSITAAAFVLSLIAFVIINAIFKIRATEREQEDGLDFSEHSANAYPDFQTNSRS